MSTKLNQQRDHYSLRKFKTAGLASALIGVSTISFLLTNNKPVKAAANSGEPNEEANNDAMHKEQQDDLQSGTTTTTTETRQAPTTKVTPLKPKKQTNKQEPAKEQTKPEESKPNKEPEAKAPEKKTTPTVKKTPTVKPKTDNQNRNEETPAQKEQDKKNALKDLTETTNKLHKSLKEVKSNNDASVNPIDLEASDNAKQTATQEPVKIGLTTESFILPKKQLTKFNANMLNVSLAEIPDTNNPQNLSPSIFKDGTKWTPAGWTRSNSKYVAKKSSLNINFGNDTFDGRAWFVHYLSQTSQPSIDATIDKNQLVKGNSILLAAVQSVKDDKQNDNQIPLFDSGYYSSGGTSVYLNGNQLLGHIRATNLDNEEVDYYLDVDNTIQTASDPTIQWTDKSPTSLVGYMIPRVYKNGIGDIGVDFNKFAQNLNSTYKIVTNKTIHTMDFSGTPTPAQGIPDNVNSYGIYNDPACTGVYYSGLCTYWLNPNQDQVGVFKVSSANKLINLNANPYVYIRTRYYDVYNNQFYNNPNPADNASNSNPWLSMSKFNVMPDNMSNTDLLNATPENTMSYSKTSDGYLVAYRFTPSYLATKGETYIRPITETGYDTNITLKDANKEDVINQTLNYYKSRNYVPSQIDLLFATPTLSNSKDDVLTVTNLTPGQTPSSYVTTHNSNSSNSNAAMYRSIPINYIDDDDNGKIVGTDTTLGITGQDLLLNPTMDLTIPNKYVLSQYNSINYGIVQDKNNKPIDIHVKHKIVGTANNLHENAHDERDYILNKIQTHHLSDLITETSDKSFGLDQHLQIWPDEQSNVNVEILDNNFAHYMNDAGNLAVKDHHNQAYTPNRALKINDGENHEGAFARATYTNLHGASYDGSPISKIVVTYSNWKYSPVAYDPFNKGAALYIDKDFASGFSFIHATNVDIDVKMYDANGNQINFDKSSYLTLGSLNSKGKNSNYVESARLLSNGKAIGLPDSSVTAHGDKMLYSDEDNDAPKWTSEGKWDVDDATNPLYYKGAGLFDITGSNDIQIRFGSGAIYNRDYDQQGGGFMWANMLTQIPNLSHILDNYSDNITIIHDPDQNYQAKYNDTQDQNDKINQVSKDYMDQISSISKQIKDWQAKTNDYNQKKQAFIQSLKDQGLWSDDMVDPTSVKQNLHLDLNNHNNSIRPTVTILDPSDVHLDNNNHVIFDTDNAVSGAFARAEYDGITNSYYRGTPISKMVVTLSNVKKGAKSANGYISVANGINNGIWRENIVGADLDIQFYDNNGNLITFGDDAYLTVSSLNGRSNGDGSTAGSTEAVKLLSDGQAMQLPQSGVKVHTDGGMYMDGGHDTPESLGLPSSLDYWDNSTSPNRIFGSAMIHVKGNHIKLRSYDYSDYTTDHNVGTGPWFIWSTMLPPLSFDQQPPKLELHYHNDNLQLTKTSTYQVIEKMPSPKYGKDQTILKTTITAGKDIARDLVTGKTQETQFTGRNTHGNVEVGQTDGVDQTVIWGKQPTIAGYHFNPFQAETKEHFDHVGGTDWTDHGAILSVSSTDNTIHFDYLVGQNYQSATNLGDSLIFSDLPDSQTWYVTLSPNQQNTQVVYVDDDANGKQVGSQAISGLTDQETNHIFLDQFDHSKYTIDGNHLSKSIIQSDQLDGSITSYNIYEQTSPDYANYNFVNIYNKHNNQWTNVTSDPNNRLIIHLKEKTIGTTDPGNIIDPIHNLKGENVGPNITWIQDPNRETVVDDDQATIDNALNNIANDYNTQEESIRNQLKDYYNRLDQFNQKRQNYIDQLKKQGVWSNSDIDPSTLGQALHIPHDFQDTYDFESLDPNFATIDPNNHTVVHVKAQTDHQGAFAKATYTNLHGITYDNQPISKIEVTFSNWHYSNNAWDPSNLGPSIQIGNNFASGFTYKHAAHLDADIKMYDANGKQITFNKQSLLTFGSLNSGGSDSNYTESVQLLSHGKAYTIPGSSVSVHNSNWLYSDKDNGTWNGINNWDIDDPTNPIYSIGSGMFDVTGSSDINLRFYSGNVKNIDGRNEGGGSAWATYVTTVPPMSFDAQAPKLEIHYHTNSLRANTNRKYSVTYTYPPEVSSYYDNYTYADIVQAHRYAGKNLVTGQKAYSHYYGDHVSDDITQNKALRLSWNNIYGFTTKSDIPDGAIINNNQGIAITKDHTAFNNDFDNLADSYNYHVYYTPGEVLAKAQFIDEDTGQLVQENPFYGYVGQTVDVSNIPVPKNYRIADDSSKPDTYKMLSSSDSTAPDDQGFIVYVVQDTQQVQDAPRNIHIVVNGHDNLSGDITYTRDGIYNKVTGQTTWNPWTVYNSSASLNGMTDMYTLNGADIADLENNNINYTVDANGSRIANGTLTQDNSNYNLTLSPDSPYFDGKTDLTYVINLNTVPANKEQYIIYEDRETHEQLGESSIKGPVGSQQSYTVKHFDGYLDPQGLPPTLEIKEDDTPYVIYLDRLAVYIPANNPVNEGDSVHAYDGDYVGDDTFPGGLNEGALNHYVTRTIYVTKNGQTTKNVTTYHFTRDAYYYPANGEIKYTNWSEDQTFPVFKLDHNGVTPIVEGSQTDANGDIPAVTVGANDSDITIDVSYESNDKGITLIWQDSDMSNREIRRHSMSIDQFKQSDNPEKAVLPDFKYTDEDHPETFNDYSKNFNFKLEDTDGNILAQGDLSNLKSVVSLLKEKNNGYLLIFSKSHGYQYVQNKPDDEYPPIKSTYRIVNVTFPDGQTVQFRYGARWKLADRRRDMTTGIKNAISNEGYIPASYIGTKDGTYPEINDEFIQNLLIQNGYVDDLSGYTIKADGDTSFMSLNADSPNEVVNVSFVGKRAGTKVEIVDTAGNVLAYNYLSGHIGQTLDINYPDIPAGYSNAGYAYYPKTYTFTKEHPDPIIVRVAKTGYANGQSVPTDNSLTTNSNGDTRNSNIKHANMFTSLFVIPQNQGQSSGTSQNNKPHSLQDQLQNLKTSKQQKHLNQSRSSAQPKQDFTQAQRQAPKPKSNFTRVKPNKIDHNNAMDASLFVRSRGSSTAKLDDSHQDLLSKLSNLGAPKAAPVKHSNAQPVNTSSINHNFTTNQNLARKLSNLKKTSPVQDRSVNVDPESNLDPTVEAATVEQDKTNAKDQTKKPDHSKEALVASLLGLSSVATAGAYAYKKKKNIKDETFNK